MVLVEGQSASNGVMIGKLFFYTRINQDIVKKTALNFDIEIERFGVARKETSDYYITLAEKYRNEVGEAEADIFNAYAEFVCDETFIDFVIDKIKCDNASAEYAVSLAGEYFASKLCDTEDEIISSRASDVRDVAGQMLHRLRAENGNAIISFLDKMCVEIEDNIILVTDDLSPSEVFQINKSFIKGLVLKKGTINSHASILARSMGIPAICGVGENLVTSFDGHIACLDGKKGKLFVEPEDEILDEYAELAEEINEKEILVKDMKGLPDETLDGKAIRICCNISDVSELDEVIDNDGQGIGLFRSEYLFLSSNVYPSEDIQFEIYKKIALKMNGKRAIIRTLDISDDKRLPYFTSRKDSDYLYHSRINNSRAFYEYPEILKSQIRAIYRASAFGNIALMFPMITSVWEISTCKKICAEVMKELESENLVFDKDTEIGAMIETPAAVLISGELAKHVDFFSVGTNDLTQYTLAVERNDYRNDRFYDNHHPAVLREIKMAVDAAHNNGIWIGICGELASDADMLSTFIAMGIDELSVNPNSVLRLRSKIRNIVASECNLDKLNC